MTSMLADTALALSRWVELSILGKATIMLVLGLTAARLTGRARASIRHLLLAATFAALLALPIVVIIAPGVTIEVPVSHLGDASSASSAISSSDAAARSISGGFGERTSDRSRRFSPTWATMVRSAWIAGALLILVSLVIDFRRFRRICRDGFPRPACFELAQSVAAGCGVRRSVEVLLHEDIAAPLTCGVLRPVIVFPADAREWSEGDLRRALVHELEHVRRGDWATQLAARAVCVGYWFHPLVWAAWRRLCLEAERACDDVVAQSAGRAEYAGWSGARHGETQRPGNSRLCPSQCRAAARPRWFVGGCERDQRRKSRCARNRALAHGCSSRKTDCRNTAIGQACPGDATAQSGVTRPSLVRSG